MWQEKLLLFLAIQEQEEGRLAKEVMEKKLRTDWPGLGREVRMICKDVGLLNITQAASQQVSEEDQDHLKICQNYGKIWDLTI